MLLPEQIVPTIMIGLSVVAAIIYLCKWDFKHTLYWVSSATIIYSVTF